MNEDEEIEFMADSDVDVGLGKRVKEQHNHVGWMQYVTCWCHSMAWS